MTASVRILLVEDDEDLRGGLRFALTQEGYSVAAAATRHEAEAALATERFDLLILDVMLPDGSGFDVCEQIRAGGARTGTAADVPIIFLTARDDEVDVVRGLDLGGDDYIGKPFRLREVLSRVKARLRRAGDTAPNVHQTAGSATASVGSRVAVTAPLSVDCGRAEVRRYGRVVSLTTTEYRLLLALVENPGQTLTRDRLVDRIMGMEDAAVDDNTLSVYIRRLREKLEEDPTHPRLIVTVRGLGYRYEGGEGHEGAW